MNKIFTQADGLGMLSKENTNYESVFDHPELAPLYEEFRKCIVKYPDGRIEDINGAVRMTLGFEKMKQLIMTADVQEQDIVLALFGGPGGSVRLLSLLKQRLLIAADILYHGKRP